MKFTYEIYQHQFAFLTEPAKHRPALGNLYAVDGKLYSANGYMLFEFQEDALNKEEWIEEHYENHDSSEQVIEKYFEWVDYEDDDGIYDSDCFPAPKHLHTVYPCVNPLTEASDIGQENFKRIIGKVLHKPQWTVAGTLDTSELWAKCYHQRRRFLGKDGLPCVKIPHTEMCFTVENIEAALTFPLILYADVIEVRQASDVVKLLTPQCQVVIMRYTGSENP